LRWRAAVGTGGAATGGAGTAAVQFKAGEVEVAGEAEVHDTGGSVLRVHRNNRRPPWGWWRGRLQCSMAADWSRGVDSVEAAICRTGSRQSGRQRLPLGDADVAPDCSSWAAVRGSRTVSSWACPLPPLACGSSKKKSPMGHQTLGQGRNDGCP
jgi:hypothetical protein